MNTPIESTIRNKCSQISIQSNGDAKYVNGGVYEEYVFGTYSFVSTDARGNNIYHANIKGQDLFIVKNIENYWVVRTTSLQFFKDLMSNLHKINNSLIKCSFSINHSL